MSLFVSAITLLYKLIFVSYKYGLIFVSLWASSFFSFIALTSWFLLGARRLWLPLNLLMTLMSLMVMKHIKMRGIFLGCAFLVCGLLTQLYSSSSDEHNGEDDENDEEEEEAVCATLFSHI